MAGMARAKARANHKNKNYYDNHFAITAQHKAVAKARRARWLSRRQSIEVRDRMNVAWSARHPFSPSQPICTVQRYGLPCPINPKHKAEGA